MGRGKRRVQSGGREEMGWGIDWYKLFDAYNQIGMKLILMGCHGRVGRLLEKVNMILLSSCFFKSYDMKNLVAISRLQRWAKII